MTFIPRIGGLVLTIAALNVSGGDRITGEPFATRSEVIAQRGMAATSQPLATQAALDILKAGGNAIDAAIAANAVLGLVEPTGNGIGGDLFAIVWEAKSKKLHGLNASGRSPRSLDLAYFKEQGMDKIPSHGPLPVSVPGAVDGWFELHERFGEMPMSAILEPAIDYAENGFGVTEVIAYYWNRSVPILEAFPGFRETYMPKGRAPMKGEVFRNPRLAKTLRRLAQEGRDVFYRGDMAREIDTYMRENGGFLRYEDMAAHTSEWVAPVSTDYRGYTVWELPPNGQGIAALQILNILEGYDIAAMGHDSVEYLHHFVEAKKLAFEDRARFYADPAFVDIPVANLISKEYATERRALIDSDKAATDYPAGDARLEDGDTIYLTVADSDGNMVSLIQSNYRGMGSGMTPGKLGFILQDRGELFSLDPTHANVYAPGKRPFHTIIPSFVTLDGEPLMSFGLMGGGMQPQGHAQIVINLVDFGMNLQEAGDAARVRHDGSSEPTGEVMTDGGTVNLESGFSEAARVGLEKLGHKVKVGASGYGGYQAIWWDKENGVYLGASESRKDGHAAGY
ncbi:MAG: gamma-glutamyltransferase [Gammaproteobacteria bacterium]